MLKSVKSRAEEQFAASKKKEKQFLNEKEKARLESAKKVARLRALRLAKEAADKEAADEAEAEKAAAKNKKNLVSPWVFDASHSGRKGRHATLHRPTAIGVCLPQNTDT